MSTQELCADCHTSQGKLEIRKRILCQDCFARYVNQKVLKRMEFYRFQNLVGDNRPRLLLPLSGGPSSLVLLHALNIQLNRQREMRNMTAYDLVLVHIETSPSHEPDHVAKWRDNILGKFPSLEFLPIVSLFDIFRVDSKIEADLQHLGISRNLGDDDSTFLIQTYGKLKTPTARADLQEIFLQRLVVASARAARCSGVVWGHSDSRLAAKALANVAKGRGGAVPNTIADGLSPHGIMCHYPLRDLFRVELDLYLDSVMGNPSDLILAEKGDGDAPVSIRHTSIDHLLSVYITSQGEKYPGIMANVVRTAGKLQVPATTSSACCLCAMPIKTAATTMSMCYGCERMRQDVITG